MQLDAIPDGRGPKPRMVAAVPNGGRVGGDTDAHLWHDPGYEFKRVATGRGAGLSLTICA